MTRQRKEIQKKMEVLSMQEQAEYEMGCGFCTTQIQEIFAPLWQKLYEKLARTYGKTVDEYMTMQYETQEKLYEAGLIPFC